MFILWISFSLVTVAMTKQEYLKTISGKKLKSSTVHIIIGTFTTPKLCSTLGTWNSGETKTVQDSSRPDYKNC